MLAGQALINRGHCQGACGRRLCVPPRHAHPPGRSARMSSLWKGLIFPVSRGGSVWLCVLVPTPSGLLP